MLSRSAGVRTGADPAEGHRGTKTEVWDKLKKLRAEAEAGLKTSASYTLAKAVDDWAAEATAPATLASI